MTNNLISALNVQVANFSVLYEKLHHFHWFVKGSQFFTLHEKFQEDYEEVTELVDEIAERMIQIGATPVSSLKSYLETTTLTENQGTVIEAEDYVRLLLVDYKHLVSEFAILMDLAAEAGDKVTEDLFVGISKSFEKKIWLYSAFLGE